MQTAPAGELIQDRGRKLEPIKGGPVGAVLNELATVHFAGGLIMPCLTGHGMTVARRIPQFRRFKPAMLGRRQPEGQEQQGDKGAEADKHRDQ